MTKNVFLIRSPPSRDLETRPRSSPQRHRGRFGHLDSSASSATVSPVKTCCSNMSCGSNMLPVSHCKLSNMLLKHVVRTCCRWWNLWINPDQPWPACESYGEMIPRLDSVPPLRKYSIAWRTSNVKISVASGQYQGSMSTLWSSPYIYILYNQCT